MRPTVTIPTGRPQHRLSLHASAAAQAAHVARQSEQTKWTGLSYVRQLRGFSPTDISILAVPKNSSDELADHIQSSSPEQRLRKIAFLNISSTVPDQSDSVNKEILNRSATSSPALPRALLSPTLSPTKARPDPDVDLGLQDIGASRMRAHVELCTSVENLTWELSKEEDNIMTRKKVDDYTHAMTIAMQRKLEFSLSVIEKEEQEKLIKLRKQVREMLRYYHLHEGEIYDICQQLRDADVVVAYLEHENESLRKKHERLKAQSEKKRESIMGKNILAITAGEEDLEVSSARSRSGESLSGMGLGASMVQRTRGGADLQRPPSSSSSASSSGTKRLDQLEGWSRSDNGDGDISLQGPALSRSESMQTSQKTQLDSLQKQDFVRAGSESRSLSSALGIHASASTSMGNDHVDAEVESVSKAAANEAEIENDDEKKNVDRDGNNTSAGAGKVRSLRNVAIKLRSILASRINEAFSLRTKLAERKETLRESQMELEKCLIEERSRVRVALEGLADEAKDVQISREMRLHALKEAKAKETAARARKELLEDQLQDMVSLEDDLKKMVSKKLDDVRELSLRRSTLLRDSEASLRRAEDLFIESCSERSKQVEVVSKRFSALQALIARTLACVVCDKPLEVATTILETGETCCKNCIPRYKKKSALERIRQQQRTTLSTASGFVDSDEELQTPANYDEPWMESYIKQAPPANWDPSSSVLGIFHPFLPQLQLDPVTTAFQSRFELYEAQLQDLLTSCQITPVILRSFITNRKKARDATASLRRHQ